MNQAYNANLLTLPGRLIVTRPPVVRCDTTGCENVAVRHIFDSARCCTMNLCRECLKGVAHPALGVYLEAK